MFKTELKQRPDTISIENNIWTRVYLSSRLSSTEIHNIYCETGIIGRYNILEEHHQTVCIALFGFKRYINKETGYVSDYKIQYNYYNT